MKMIIRNARILSPGNGIDCCGDIVIRDGIVDAIVPSDEAGCGILDADRADPDTEVIDARGMIASPGLIDTHVHFRDPGYTHKETILTGSMAAVVGGYTTVVMMANTNPVNDCPDTYLAMCKSIKEANKCVPLHIIQDCAVTKGLQGKALTDMEELAELGAGGFTDDGIPIMDENLLKEAMVRATRINKCISLHEENPAYINGSGVNSGEIADSLGLGGADREAEITLCRRDIDLALSTGAQLVIQHISASESVGIIREARRRSNKIHAEATPHHFSLTEDAVIEHGTLAKMNPPLRTEEDRQAIIEGLKDGTIEIIATDHAPHSIDEKNKPFPNAPSGIIGLETALSLGITNLVNTGYLTMSELIMKMTDNPARLYHLNAGRIEVGGRADIVIFDPNEEWTYLNPKSKSQNSPFIGSTLKGRVHYTICDGKIAFQL